MTSQTALARAAMLTPFLAERTVCRTCDLGSDSDRTPSYRYGVNPTPRVEVNT